MNDGNDKTKAPKSQTKEIGGKQVNVRTIAMNENEIQVVKLGDIADVKQGLATGDNDAYLFQNPDARGTYRNIDDYRKYLLTELDLEKIRNNETLRLSVINTGISKDNPITVCYFGGKYIIPYDKGGESDAEGGWMPNYYVPTNYFIDWSDWAVFEMKTRTSEKQAGKIASRFQNIETYFNFGISFSDTGFYAPTFRYGSGSVYDVMGMTVFQLGFSNEIMLSFLSSKLIRLFIKLFINHTVHTQVDGLKPIPISLINEELIVLFANRIISNQKSNPRYDYASHEQLEIDKLVYEAYGLSPEDVLEVENWYARRYSKLSVAQKANLRALGKSDDYLELYGIKKIQR